MTGTKRRRGRQRPGLLRAPRNGKTVKIEAVALHIILRRHIFEPTGDRGIDSETASLIEHGKPTIKESGPIGPCIHGVRVLDEPPIEMNHVTAPGRCSTNPDFAQRPQMGAFVGFLVVLVDKVLLESLSSRNEIVGKCEA